MTACLADVGVQTKTYVTLVLVGLAVVEFFTAMYVFGRKGEKNFTKGVLTTHRILGYAFLVFWLWPMFVGLDMLHDMYGIGAAATTQSADAATSAWRSFNGARFYHAALAVLVLILLVLKVLFVRVYTNYRPSARLLGILITVGAVLIWMMTGWFWLAAMGGTTFDR